MDKTVPGLAELSASDTAVRQGHYAKKQIFSSDRLISWSHRSRFEMGLRLARPLAEGRRVLDYGCGDGTFLAMLRSAGRAPAEAVGCEVHEGLVSDCRRRLGGEGISFVVADELGSAEYARRFDLVVCMEVLEHVVDLDPLLGRLDHSVKRGGHLLVSVPVETGLPLLVKQAARRVAGWRGIGDYPGTNPYTLGEMLAALFAGRTQHIKRHVHVTPDGRAFHDHKGFNWMALRERLSGRFELIEVLSSPVTWLPPHLASQAWFLLRQRD